MLGTKLYKPIVQSEYSALAQWSNDNGAMIVDRGDYYECVAIPPPTERELLEQELSLLLAWFSTYDEKCMQYQRAVRTGIPWDDNIEQWDNLARINSARIKEIRQSLIY